MAPLRGGSSGGALAPTTASTPHLTRGAVLHAVNETTPLDALPASSPSSSESKRSMRDMYVVSSSSSSKQTETVGKNVGV